MKIGILGAGPAGLFAAWLLRQRGVDVRVFEATDRVGGIARSFAWHGFTCDLGAHRLFTNDESVLRSLLMFVPMGRHSRRSQIYLQGKWLRDPVNVSDLLYHYFPGTATRIVWDYLTRSRHSAGDSFDGYVEARYGRALNAFFFRPYTEKMFGLPGNQISADWARRKVRISGPLDALRENTKRRFSYFYYPVEGGYGAISARLHEELGEQVRLSTPVLGLEPEGERIGAVRYCEQGTDRRESFDHVISTLSLTLLGRLLGRQFDVGYRGVDFVYLLVDRPNVSDNHWVYFMDGDCAINRLVEFKNLSPVGQPASQTVLCAEVTDTRDDVTEHVIGDVVRSGLVRRQEIVDTLRLRESFGYPVFDRGYAGRLAGARAQLALFKNLHFLGRAAQFEHLEVDDVFANAVALVGSLPLPSVIPGILPRAKGVVMSAANTSPFVCAVILAYNHYDDTRECLESLLASDYDNLRVAVVDNGSSDATVARVRADFPTVHVIECGRNLGVPWGFNVGFSYALHAGAEYVLMLNNDTAVARDMLRRLVEAGQNDPDSGVLMPKVLYYDNPQTVWAAGGRHRYFPPAHVILGQGESSSGFNKPFQLEYALSCGLLIHRRAFERAGLFDPGYFFQFDDWDFSQRVRAHGLHITLIPGAELRHKVSKSTRETGKEALFWRVWGASSTRFYRRHGRPVFLSLPAHLGYLMLRELAKGNRRYLKYFWAGVREGLTKPLGPIPQSSELIVPPGQVGAG